MSPRVSCVGSCEGDVCVSKGAFFVPNDGFFLVKAEAVQKVDGGIYATVAGGEGEVRATEIKAVDTVDALTSGRGKEFV